MKTLRMGTLGQIRVRFTDDRDGSFDLAATGLEARRRLIVGLDSVSWLRQAHGAVIIAITDSATATVAGLVGDVLICDQPGHAVSVITADCAPIALWTESGVVGAVHAGWKGLMAGVIETAIEAIRALSAGADVYAWLGPCIGPECYGFSEGDLSQLCDRYGPLLRSQTWAGDPALDMGAGVRIAVERASARFVGSAGICTACDDNGFSWRAKKSVGRQALFVWHEPKGPAGSRTNSDQNVAVTRCVAQANRD